MIPGIGPSNARIMIVGDAPSSEDSARREPFCGGGGMELTRMLHDAGLNRSDIFLTNLFRTPLPKDPRTGKPELEDIFHFPVKAKQRGAPGFRSWNDAQVHESRWSEVELLAKEISLVQPTIIIPTGNAALWYLSGKTGIGTWRSSLLGGGDQPKVIPTYHPDAVTRQWDLRHIVVHDLKRAAAHQGSRTYYNRPQWNFLLAPTFGDVVQCLLDLLSRASKGPLPLVLDIETRRGHTACLGLAWSRLEALCIPLMCAEDPLGYWSAEHETWIIHSLMRLLLHPNVTVIGQNLVYDYQYLWRHWGFYPSRTRDTMINHHLAWPGLPKALDFQASLYCDWYVYWKDDGKEWHDKQDEKVLWEYNATDCVRTWECDESTRATVENFGLGHLSARRHVHMYNCLRTMFRGMRVDQESRARFSASLAGELAERERRLEAYLGQPLNPRSPKQMLALLYDDLKLPIQYNRKARPPRPTADDDALHKLSLREPVLLPIVQTISEIRSIGVFKSTFVDASLDIDDRLRCSYNICGTETFRLSSSENAFGSGTNLQNVPKGDEAGLLPNVRKIFVPDLGHTIFDADLDRADLQVVVWEADDEELRAALREGVDIHSLNAKTLGISRQLAKSWVHGTNYGGGPRTMATACGITVHQAERMQARWFQAHPGIKHWHVRVERSLRETRSVSNRFGYRRVYFDRVEGLLPEALAWIPQSTVAIVINEVWAYITSHFPWIEILLQVHDSLVGQFLTNRFEEAQRAVAEAGASVVIPYSNPLTIPLGMKISTKSWGDVE